MMHDESEKFESYLRELPLLEFTSSLYPNINLGNIYIICAQHIVSTTYSLFYKLLELGLKPSNLSAIGKCYSSDPQAYDEIKKLGIDICPYSLAFESHCPFDDQYKKYIREFVSQRIHKLESNEYTKVIILDDGGELISAVNELVGYRENFVGIEQTSSGYHKVNNLNVAFPVINMARSPAKLNYESPLIANLVVDTFIRHMEAFASHPEEILIIGNGPIGFQISEVLKKSYSVSTYDIASERSSIHISDFDSALSRFDMIIGCTGKTVLQLKHHKLLRKNAILVSASSSDREFSASELRAKHAPVKDCHTNLFVNDIHLINCGFPINFDSDYRAIDIDELQLTRSLLLASILQGCCYGGSKKRGFIPLDIENQREIVYQYFSIFPNEAFDLKEQSANNLAMEALWL